MLSLLSGDEYEKKLSELQYANWRNKTVSDTYDPGSIFKLITCSMALEEHVVTLDSTFTCTGSIRVEGRPTPINCWKRAGHGTQKLAKALQNSCNPAFVQIGLRVGAEKFYRYLKDFGFGAETGIDAPGEATGILHDYDYFMKHNDSLAVAAFGQTFTVTPIQMITAVSAVVNGGNLMTPHVVKEYLDSDGNLVKEVEPNVERQVISEETSKTMRTLMEGVVAEGTGRNAQVAGYRIGGKTATSEKSIDGKYIDGKYVVSFMAVAPIDDPKIALLVLIDTPGDKVPTTQRSGGFLAAPTAGKMLSEILPYMGIEPSFTGEEMFGAQITVPQVTGYSLENVKGTLDSKKIAYKIVGDGESVTGQLPAAGATVTASSEIILYAGSDKDTSSVTVPNVVGMSPEKANKAITNAGLYMLPSGALAAQTSTVSAASQDIAGGTEVAKGTIVGVVFKDTAVSDYAAG
jgi:stage V sporulation protein D (sporulation-specific penicillin-binding protein)